MAGKQKQQSKKGAPSSSGRGSQKNHAAGPDRGHRKNPGRILRRIIQSSGFSEAQRWADKFGAQIALSRIQRGSKGEVRWIARKKIDILTFRPDCLRIDLRTGRALQRHPLKAVES